MKSIKVAVFLAILLFSAIQNVRAQDEGKNLKLSGSLLTDQRFLLQKPHDWAWNENRLTIKLDAKFSDNARFHSEVWLRNIGLPQFSSTADLYNKGIIDPFNIDVREAYVQLYGFLSKNLDVKIGRQRIAWGTADRLNPTDNLNPYDLEDVLDFGRHRGSDGITLDYYFNTDYSVEAVFIPFFQPANLPVGIFANVLTPEFDLPGGIRLDEFTDETVKPRYNLAESTTAGLKFKGFAGGVDFSLSYVWGRDGLPLSTYNTFSPNDSLTAINIHSTLSFTRHHIFGADMATAIGGLGLWAEAAAFLPDHEVVMTNDFSPLFPALPPVTSDSVILKKELYVKFVIGADYRFAGNMYLNFQYLHGFVNERGRDNLNDYFFIQYDMTFFDERLKVAPLAGAFIVSDWKNTGDNHAIIYAPSITYMATDNAEISLSAPLFFGSGDNIFAQFTDYDMFMFRFKYSF